MVCTQGALLSKHTGSQRGAPSRSTDGPGQRSASITHLCLKLLEECFLSAVALGRAPLHCQAGGARGERQRGVQLRDRWKGAQSWCASGPSGAEPRALPRRQAQLHEWLEPSVGKCCAHLARLLSGLLDQVLEGLVVCRRMGTATRSKIQLGLWGWWDERGSQHPASSLGPVDDAWQQKTCLHTARTSLAAGSPPGTCQTAEGGRRVERWRGLVAAAAAAAALAPWPHGRRDADGGRKCRFRFSGSRLRVLKLCSEHRSHALTFIAPG